ncbi:hypothetical protein BZL35_00951 [Candidatus Pandoraea novymonadis]|uniref:Lipoprotein n=2 Tax=Candidatus Pandoraea novymonadis TaxID=1808959 RepID=A0ABX5FCJ2_9BURK|nr:lipoprotein [Candidatus Pandoraea novymonadis]PSB91554.1 hypothetical protein BZL35_00951 [Candidatus Pandoraea novymonadis]
MTASFTRIRAIVASIKILGTLSILTAGCGQTGPLYLPTTPLHSIVAPPVGPIPTPTIGKEDHS